MSNIAHIVICPYCNQKFDTDKEPFEKPSSRRYAHKKCYETAMANKNEEDRAREELENYIKSLFHIDIITPKINKQIKDYITNYKYSYTGILATLKYAFEIKHNDIDKANGGIGIVPYLYQEAWKYNYNLWKANTKNEQILSKDKNKKGPKVIEVIIPEPKRKPMKKRKFKFLEEDKE